jgi:hypothetical protein
MQAALRGALAVLLGGGVASLPLLFHHFGGNSLIQGAAEAAGALVALAVIVVIVFRVAGSD